MDLEAHAHLERIVSAVVEGLVKADFDSRVHMRFDRILHDVRQWVRWEGRYVSDRDVRARVAKLKRPPSRRCRRHCLDCGIDTIAIGHYPYNARDDVWQSVVPGGHGMLCLGCFAARLGRPLKRTDFA